MEFKVKSNSFSKWLTNRHGFPQKKTGGNLLPPVSVYDTRSLGFIPSLQALPRPFAIQHLS